METTFYQDEGIMSSTIMDKKEQSSKMEAPESVALGLRENCTFKELKKKMHLDFSAIPTKKSKLNPILTSPDMNLLKLGSPELERMIIAQHGMITTTPTPTQYLFPKSVTEEQELYAKGFVDALAQLQGQPSKTEISQANGMSTAPPFISLLPVDATSSNVAGSVTSVNTTANGTALSFPHPRVGPRVVTQPMPPQRLVTIKEEPQTVPCLGSTPPLSPIDMDAQERIKLERKRQRNRVAASKCRRRKLERISHLEAQVDDVKSVNSNLLDQANQLRDQVAVLKQRVLEHINHGCQIALNPGLI